MLYQMMQILKPLNEDWNPDDIATQQAKMQNFVRKNSSKVVNVLSKSPSTKKIGSGLHLKRSSVHHQSYYEQREQARQISE